MSKKISIHWFRQDLRISDNPALINAASHENILPIYILDDKNSGEYKMGGASRWWLHHSLKSLNESLKNGLSLYKGDALKIIEDLIRNFEIEAFYWNRCYEPWRIARDKKIKEFLVKQGIKVETSNGSLLWEPWNIKKKDGTPYKVFTPFYRNGCLDFGEPREPLGDPEIKNIINDEKSLKLDSLELLPKESWDKNLDEYWDISEDAAHERFSEFLKNGIDDYKEGRNIPSKKNVSRMSPYLHFGQVSPNQLWYRAKFMEQDHNVDHFCSELGWREFSYSQLFYNPELPKKNLQPKFDRFPWVDDDERLKAWQKGMTGVPMVDAGMRELWQTGYMHNRVRMVVGSFLVKNLRLHWHHGERWFFDTLADADLANNSASWQWIAGCGADAAPYFRIFNCVTQGEKFDPKGEYIRKYIPEIAELPNKYLFAPWEAPEMILMGAGVKLGKTYPKPIVDLKESRNEALEAFSTLKKA